MKLINKNDMRFENGYLLDKKGNIINDGCLVREVNDFALAMRLAGFIKDNQAVLTTKLATQMPKFKDKDEKIIAIPEPSTECVDAQVNKTMAILDEMDDIKCHDEAQQFVDHFPVMCRFIKEESVPVNYDVAVAAKFDANPLELTEEIVIEYATFMAASKDEIKAVL